MEKYIVTVLAYIIGSLPFTFLLAKMNGVNLKLTGSGNVGATNVLRTCTKSLAASALLLDAFKGFIIVFITQKFSYDYINLSIVLAVLGHIFPVWLKFKGGKGVATTLGALLALNFILALIFFSVWIITFFLFRYSSPASLSAIVFSIIASFIIKKSLFLTLLMIGSIVFVKHYKNIKNLLEGKEYRFNKA